MDEYQTLDVNSNSADLTNHWPAQILQHFDIKHTLGKGGQGSVFLALEYQLQRKVAIKRLDNQVFNQTLLLEAQAQAKIEHPNISKLFQVIQTNPAQTGNFLVMQYIEGQTALDWATTQRQSCSNKNQWQQYINHIVNIIMQTCDGLQALHSAGILHRDIKPANIMITMDENNKIHPYIVDFGLAQQQNPNVTHSDSGSGSKPFMSPEQKNGQPLSNTSDIYSLGVTLYQLLTSQLPESNNDPIQLTDSIAPHSPIKLPIELTAIINRCLNPERQHRYQSAAELNQELQRFLAGEPITSINSNRYLIKKKIYKHRWVALFILFIGFGISAQLLWQQQQQTQIKAREALTQQFHQTVQQAQYQSNLAYMAPAHDIRYLQHRHQQNLEQIINQAQALGQSALPFALYAKGRIAQQQGQQEQAKLQLEQAWQLGFQTVESANALVKVLNNLYQQALTQTYTMPQGPLRQALTQQLQQQFVTPIVNYLQFIEQQNSRSNDNQSDKNYIRALLAYYQQDYHGAVRMLSDAQQFSPWDYQHYLLLGQSYLAQYQQLLKPKSSQAKALIKQATQAFDQALTIAPSDPNNYLQKWQLYFTLISNSQFGSGNPMAALDDAAQILKQALKVHPDHLDTHINQIRTQFQLMAYLDNDGQPSQQALDLNQTQVEQALSRWPQQSQLLRLQAKILSRQLAQQNQQNANNDQYQAITQLYTRLSQQQQLRFDDLIYWALHQKHWGDYLDNPNQARAKYQLAVQLFEQAIASRPQYSGSYVNLALVQLKLSESDTNEQSLIRLNDAIAKLQIALEKGYSEFVANYYLAKIGLEISGKIGSKDLNKSVKQLQQALKALKQAQQAKPNNYHAIRLQIEILSQLIKNYWYLKTPKPQLEKQLVALQLQKYNENPKALSSLSHSSFILTTVLEKQLAPTPINQTWTTQLQQISQSLHHQLKPYLSDTHNSPLNFEQTIALSNLIYAKMQLGSSLNQLEPLIIQFSKTTESSDHHWTLANYYQLKSKQQKDFQSKLTWQNQAISHWQQAYQLTPNNIDYHFSLLTGYVQKLMLLEQFTQPTSHSTDQTIAAIMQLNQKLHHNNQIVVWTNTILKQQSNYQLIEYLEENKDKHPFTAFMMRYG